MNRILFGLQTVLVAALILATGLVGGCVTPGVPGAQVLALKAGIAVEGAFSTVITGERTAAATGLLTGANLARAQAIVPQADTARRIVEASVEAGVVPDTVNITALIGEIIDLTPNRRLATPRPATLTPGQIIGAVELALEVLQVGTQAYQQFQAAQASNDPAALNATFVQMRAANDALMRQ